uniref:Uncharacterized protein n=1 Tax=uncultured bacterium Contig1770 TaxID=1393510 RepID=W0FN88_9BACT|nr:hypothetical protein [uncultured bacterium Contig1770]
MSYTLLNEPPALPSVNGWYYAMAVGGWALIVMLPSSRTPSSVTVGSSPRVYSSAGGWQALSYASWSMVGGNVLVQFSYPSPNNLQEGCCYLVDVEIALA